MAVKKDITRNGRTKREYTRIKKLYKDIPPDTLKVVDGLIIQAARLRILLDDMWKDLDENGDTELFSQSEHTEPYERERPTARLYNTRDKNYHSVMKQLTDLIPKEKPKPEDDGFDEFLNEK